MPYYKVCEKCGARGNAKRKKGKKKMSKWKVTSNYINGKKEYAVYRNIRDDEPDHSGNREYATGYMESREEAQKIADEKNAVNIRL